MILHQLVGDAPAADTAFDLVASTLDTRLDWPTYETQLNYIMRNWLDTGRWEHARKRYEELRPELGGAPRDVGSARRATRADGSRPGIRSEELWRRLPEREPDQAAASTGCRQR